MATVADPPLIRVLDLSTAHLPRHLGDLTSSTHLAALPGLKVYGLRYGFLMWVPTDPAEYANDQFGEDQPPPEVLAIQQYADDHDCVWVMFDADGAVVDELPVWEW